MIEQKSEVTGTMRLPDGAVQGRIDGVVITQRGGTFELNLRSAIAWAQRGLLWCKGSGGVPVQVVAVDTDRDGRDDSLRTAADSTTTNNLLALPIWDRVLRKWVNTRAA